MAAETFLSRRGGNHRDFPQGRRKAADNMIVTR